MPRLRGKPRRGAGWYAADSRRKRHRNFQRGVQMARQKRRRVHTAASSPPVTRVEEEPDLELPSDFSESKMFTVPDNWAPPTRLAAPVAMSRSTGAPGPSAAPNDKHTICMVEEEPPSSYTGVQTNTEMPENKKEVRDTKKEPEAPASPSLLHPELLQLIFEVCSLVDDQLFRAVCVS